MTYRNTGFFSIFDGKINSQTEFRLSKLFQHRQRYRSLSPTTTPSPLYLACQNNDLLRVQSCLKYMKRKEIDYQYPPNNETALHIAARNQQKEIIESLLSYGAQLSLRNTDGQQAYELVETAELKDLFKRPKSSRFAFLHSGYETSTLFQQKIKCESCSLINNNTFYEWDLVDQNASQKALKFRLELKPLTPMNEKSLRKKLYSLNKGYLNAHLQDLPTEDGACINEYFKRALRQLDPIYLITAYTKYQKFSELINTDMARNVIHDLKNGCSKFSCDCLYSTDDGTKAITSILLRHSKFQKLNFKGEVYRGVIMPKHKLDHYKVGSCIITTTFLSTSKDLAVAQVFCSKEAKDAATHSFFCTYEIVNDDHIAIDISKLSEHQDEDEVLILPYSAFLITKIEEGHERTNIYLTNSF